MSALKAERQNLYAAMHQYGDLLERLDGDTLVAFLKSPAKAAYQRAENAATDERDPAALARLVQQMNEALDGWMATQF